MLLFLATNWFLGYWYAKFLFNLFNLKLSIHCVCMALIANRHSELISPVSQMWKLKLRDVM